MTPPPNGALPHSSPPPPYDYRTRPWVPPPPAATAATAGGPAGRRVEMIGQRLGTAELIDRRTAEYHSGLITDLKSFHIIGDCTIPVCVCDAQSVGSLDDMRANVERERGVGRGVLRTSY